MQDTIRAGYLAGYLAGYMATRENQIYKRGWRFVFLDFFWNPSDAQLKTKVPRSPVRPIFFIPEYPRRGLNAGPVAARKCRLIHIDILASCGWIFGPLLIRRHWGIAWDGIWHKSLSCRRITSRNHASERGRPEAAKL